MPLPPFNDVSDERQMSLGMSIAAGLRSRRERDRLDHWLHELSTRRGIAKLLEVCDEAECDADAFITFLGKDARIAVPLLDLLVLRGVLSVTPGGCIRVCESSGLLSS